MTTQDLAPTVMMTTHDLAPTVMMTTQDLAPAVMTTQDLIPAATLAGNSTMGAALRGFLQRYPAPGYPFDRSAQPLRPTFALVTD